MKSEIAWLEDLEEGQYEFTGGAGVGGRAGVGVLMRLDPDA
jgi:hypothetical protein